MHHPHNDLSVFVAARQSFVLGVPDHTHHRAFVAFQGLVHRQITGRGHAFSAFCFRCGRVKFENLRMEKNPCSKGRKVNIYNRQHREKERASKDTSSAPSIGSVRPHRQPSLDRSSTKDSQDILPLVLQSDVVSGGKWEAGKYSNIFQQQQRT